MRGRHPSLSCVFSRAPCSADRSSRYLGISSLQLLPSFRYQISELLLAISVSSADAALTLTAPCTVDLHPSLVGGSRSIACHHGSRPSWESKSLVRWHQLRLAPPASTSEHRWRKMIDARLPRGAAASLRKKVSLAAHLRDARVCSPHSARIPAADALSGVPSATRITIVCSDSSLATHDPRMTRYPQL